VGRELNIEGELFYVDVSISNLIKLCFRNKQRFTNRKEFYVELIVRYEKKYFVAVAS